MSAIITNEKFLALPDSWRSHVLSLSCPLRPDFVLEAISHDLILLLETYCDMELLHIEDYSSHPLLFRCVSGEMLNFLLNQDKSLILSRNEDGLTLLEDSTFWTDPMELPQDWLDIADTLIAFNGFIDVDFVRLGTGPLLTRYIHRGLVIPTEHWDRLGASAMRAAHSHPIFRAKNAKDLLAVLKKFPRCVHLRDELGDNRTILEKTTHFKKTPFPKEWMALGELLVKIGGLETVDPEQLGDGELLSLYIHRGLTVPVQEWERLGFLRMEIEHLLANDKPAKMIKKH